MRIAIDARELSGHPTGVGRYLSGLLDAWAVSDHARRHEFLLISHRPVDGALRWRAEPIVVHGGGGTAWEQLTLARTAAAHRPDVFFAPGYTAPVTVAAPLVVTIHDVSFFAHPEWFSFREGMRRRLVTAWSARRARTVITDSQFSRGEIQRFIGIPAGRIRVAPLGLSPGGEDVAAPREPIVLFVGSIFKRRRVDRLMAAFEQVASRVPGARLEIVGENRTAGFDIDGLRRRSPHAGRIGVRSYVDEATLSDLYRRASVFVFLSEYEGFGLTPLEALSHGVPPLVLDTPIARETCGDAARYVPAGAGDEEVAAALTALLTDPAARDAVMRRAPDALRRYDWNRTAGDTLAILEEAALGR